MDDADRTDHLLRWGVHLADRFSAELVVFHAVDFFGSDYLAWIASPDTLLEEEEARRSANGWLKDRLATLQAVAREVAGIALDRAAAARPNPGQTPTLRRLNRTEYQNVIRDLLALEVDAAALLVVRGPPQVTGPAGPVMAGASVLRAGLRAACAGLPPDSGNAVA